MIEFAITTAVLVAICGILATKDQSPNSSPQSVASGNALERGRFFFSPVSCAAPLAKLSRQDRQAVCPAPAARASRVLDRTDKQALRFDQPKGPSLLVCPRRNRQARQLPGAVSFLERTDKQGPGTPSALSVLGGINKHAQKRATRRQPFHTNKEAFSVWLTRLLLLRPKPSAHTCQHV